MSNPKIIHELTTEELLAIAAGAKPEEVIEKISEAAKFIYAENIKEGREDISAQLVYHTYKHYKGWGNKRQSRHEFYKDFNKYFTPFRKSDGMYYNLDPKPFDTSEKNYWDMKAEQRAQKTNKKK